MANEIVSMNGNAVPVGTVASSGKLSVFSDAQSFETALRMAQVLAGSTVVPKSYQNNVGNCMIAIEMASRIKTSPMMVMQNLYIVNGNPAWSSQWIIAMINSSKRYKTELQFEFGHDPEDGGLSCLAYAEDYSGHRVEGPKITMTMAEKEGWLNKSGSKWRTMPEVMIRYRAASFFGRVNCPDMIMGIYTQEEVYDMGEVQDADYSSFSTNPETGEVVKANTAREDDDPIITQEQRQALFKAAQSAFGKEKGNELLKGIMQELGLESTAGIRRSQYKEIMEDLLIASEAREAHDRVEEDGELPFPDDADMPEE